MAVREPRFTGLVFSAAIAHQLLNSLAPIFSFYVRVGDVVENSATYEADAVRLTRSFASVVERGAYRLLIHRQTCEVSFERIFNVVAND